MNNKIILALFALMMGMATATSAQNYNRYDNRHDGYNDDRNYNRDNDNYYQNNGNGQCNNNTCYQGNGGNCNSNDCYRNANRRNRCGNGYGYRRVYRRPVNYCQQVPVVVYNRPRYCPPAPRVVIGRPRININIGF